ncbi:MAG: gamma-glutamyltransferase [Phycisphaerales bacterium]|nr:gamma-glutamyltransferase [Phycisphaerales bacterium]
MRRASILIGFLALLTGAAGCGSGGAGFRNGAVAADHEIASLVGVEILKKGGNAVDAAVATSFALSVVRPYSCGLGGGGFMVIHLANGEPGKHGRAAAAAGDYAINYRETAPAASMPDYFLNHPDPLASRVGATAVGVPGSVAGLMLALERYGRLERKEVLKPAIRRARTGFLVDEDYVRSCRRLIADFKEHPEYQQRFAFVWERYLRRGTVKVGDRIKCPEQAAALQLISDLGAGAFYSGPIADAIVTASRADGGEMNLGDLGAYRAVEMEPLKFQFDGRTVVTMPPPSSGGVAMAEALKIYTAIEPRAAEIPGAARALAVLREYRPPEPEPGRGLGESLGAAMSQAFFIQSLLTQVRQSPYVVHPLTEAFKHAFADRAEWLGDPAFVDVPVDRLISDEYAAQRADTFDPAHTLTPDRYGTRAPGTAEPAGDHGTSHFSVIDRWGNAVACTETINTDFGSLLAVEPYGFVLNNEMDDFTTRPGTPNAYGLIQSPRNAPAPGKRPLSSMTPTIALAPDGRVEAVLGASGGPRIITAVTQVLLLALRDRDLIGSADLMVREPRLHHQWGPDVLELEGSPPPQPLPMMMDEKTGRWSGSASLYDARGPSIDQDRSLADRMRELGHVVKKATSHAVVQLLLRHPDGTLDAASDPRKGGKPAAY